MNTPDTADNNPDPTPKENEPTGKEELMGHFRLVKGYMLNGFVGRWQEHTQLQQSLNYIYHFLDKVTIQPDDEA